ncbi:YihY/virulence factor BrkB family protein [Microbacterium deminutum]|uniref:YihY/virulence factor BrkB family protein n=1 Tax=Microbacterium deminutum TaxID=344164 RepID=A0ABN2QB77_9MICO
MKDLIERVTAWALTLKPVRAFLLYADSRGPMLADSISYRTMFSVFAGVFLGFSVASLWLAGNPDVLNSLVSVVDAAIPGLLGDQGLIDPKTIQAPAGLTITGIVALVALLGAAIGAIGSLRMAFRQLARHVHDDIFWIWVMLRNVVIAIGIGAAFLASAVITFYGTAGIGALTEWLGRGPDDPLTVFSARALSIAVVFVLDALCIGILFRLLSGLKPSARSLWSGALLGAVALTVLQQLSFLFVGAVSRNPIYASFASLIALLVWLNLSAQVILIAGAYIITGVAEESDRVRARYGARTFAQRRVRDAEDLARLANEELVNARAGEEKERTRG